MNLTLAQARVMSELTSRRPQAVAIIGDRQVGKSVLVASLKRHYNVLDADYIQVSNLNSSTRQEIQRFTSYAPVGEFSMVVIDIRTFTDAAALAGVLEYAHKDAFFVVMAPPNMLPKSVLGRCEVHALGVPSNADVARLLDKRIDNANARARLARSSAGRMPDLAENIEAEGGKPLALKAIKAIIDNDQTSLEETTKDWTDVHTMLVVDWCQDFVTKRWRRFDAEDISCDRESIPLTILAHLRLPIRPRLTSKASLVEARKAIHGTV